ncbi:Imm8 family immunity protein [Nocardia sp. NPDC005825]|uniref:Imm8 family immunity protein n=1 Tax=unclassified Nocardia TaxID=2637762 RepID=UPI0033E14C39
MSSGHTPNDLRRLPIDQPMASGRHYLFVEHIDMDVLTNWIVRYLAALDEPSWGELALKVARLGTREFEDYRA